MELCIQTEIEFMDDQKKLFLIEKYPYDLSRDDFGNKVVQIAQDVQTDPDYLMMALYIESHFRANFRNHYGTGDGMLPFIQSQAKRMGTTVQEIEEMTPLEQLDCVHDYYKHYEGRLNSLIDVYLAFYFPLAFNKNDQFRFRFPAKWKHSNLILGTWGGASIFRWEVDSRITRYFMEKGWR